MAKYILPSALGKQVESTKRSFATIRIAEGKAKTDVEWAEYFAKGTPAPGDYTLRQFGDFNKTGKFSTARPIGYIDAAIHKGQREPGPADYERPMLDSAVNRPGGRFSNFKPKNFIEQEEYISKSIPGPGAYKRFHERKRTGKFSTANPKSDVEWKVYYASTKPAANAYILNGKTRYDANPTSGGRFSTSKPMGFIDRELLRVSDHPGSASYDLVVLPRSHRDRKQRTITFSSGDTFHQQMRALLSQSSARRKRRKKRKKKKKKKKGAVSTDALDYLEHKEMENEELRELIRENKAHIDLLPSRARRILEENEQRTPMVLQYEVDKLDSLYRNFGSGE